MTTKDTNPKDAVGIRKWRTIACIPFTVLWETGLGMLEGARKYGRHNYRVAGVRGSVYVEAAMGHIMQWWEGEDTDPDTGLSHITKAICSLVVLRDAMIQQKFVDDRPPRTNIDDLRNKLQHVMDDIFERIPDARDAYVEGDQYEDAGPSQDPEPDKAWDAWVVDRIDEGTLVLKDGVTHHGRRIRYRNGDERFEGRRGFTKMLGWMDVSPTVVESFEPCEPCEVDHADEGDLFFREPDGTLSSRPGRRVIYKNGQKGYEVQTRDHGYLEADMSQFADFCAHIRCRWVGVTRPAGGRIHFATSETEEALRAQGYSDIVWDEKPHLVPLEEPVSEKDLITAMAATFEQPIRHRCNLRFGSRWEPGRRIVEPDGEIRFEVFTPNETWVAVRAPDEVKDITAWRD